MRTIVEIQSPYPGVWDTSWITQEICEGFAGASIGGEAQLARYVGKVSQFDAKKMQMLQALLTDNPDIEDLKQELIEEFGIEKFIRTKSRLEHIRDLEDRMASEKSGAIYAQMLKELRELKVWVQKPTEASPVNINVNNNVPVDTSNPKELERHFMSIMN